MKIKILALTGLPGCGKSSYARELMEKEPGKWKRTNKDEIRAMVDNSQWSKKNEEMVINIRNTIIHHSLNHGYNVIVDDTNFNHLDSLEQIAKDHGADFEIKDFTDVPLQTCIERDLKRLNSVGKDVIMKMYRQYIEKPIEPYIAPKGTPDAILVDIDGTIARMINRSPFDWDKVGQDEIHEDIVEILDKYKNDHEIIIVSGRDGSCFEQTKKWIEDFKIPCNYLCMREAGNNEKDYIVKERIFNENIRGKYNIKFVLDDRKQVVDQWRRMGLRCLQVADGEF